MRQNCNVYYLFVKADTCTMYYQFSTVCDMCIFYPLINIFMYSTEK